MGIKSDNIIYSLKIISVSQNERELSLSVLNNGLSPLKDLQVGLITVNGEFKAQRYFDSINPQQTINVTVDVAKKEGCCASAIKTTEGVGEILYLT